MMNNGMLFDMLMCKRQGMEPMEAFQKLAGKYPQFQKALPLIQNMSPEQMRAAAQETARHMGIDPAGLEAAARETINR